MRMDGLDSSGRQSEPWSSSQSGASSLDGAPPPGSKAATQRMSSGAKVRSVDPLDEFGEPFAVAVAIALTPLHEAIDVGNSGPEIELVRGLLF